MSRRKTPPYFIISNGVCPWFRETKELEKEDQKGHETFYCARIENESEFDLCREEFCPILKRKINDKVSVK